MDDPSHSDTIHFVSVPGSYLPGEDVLARYQVQETCGVHARDWIGLFRVGWTSKRDYYTFEWAPANKEDAQCVVKFVGSRLPHEDGNFYQFCYVSRDGDVRGSSRPFQFTKLAKRNLSDDLEMVEVEDDASLVLLRSRTGAQVMELENKIAELNQKNENVEGSFVQVQSECQGIKAERDQTSAELTACKEQLQQANECTTDLQSALVMKDKEIFELKESCGAKDDKQKELQEMYDQVEQALLGTAAEKSQLQQVLTANEKTKDEEIAALTAANKTLAAKKEESETELRMQCTNLEEQHRNLGEEKEVLRTRNEYYMADNERLEECVQDQKAQLAALEQEIGASTEQLNKDRLDTTELRRMLSVKEEELMVNQQNLCEVMGNIKEPRDILPKKTAEEDTVDKSVYVALQRAYEDVEIRWNKDERVIVQLKIKVAELEERVRRCEQEYKVIVTENTTLKKSQQQSGGEDVTDWKEQAQKSDEELRVFQEKHDQRIADKNDQLQKQQEILDAKFTEVTGLQEQQKAMQNLIDTLNKENGQLKQQIHRMQEENATLHQPIPAPCPSPGASDAYQPVAAPRPRPQRPTHAPPHVDSNSNVCPVCGVRFPHTVNQLDIERHVNGHFDS